MKLIIRLPRVLISNKRKAEAQDCFKIAKFHRLLSEVDRGMKTSTDFSTIYHMEMAKEYMRIGARKLGFLNTSDMNKYYRIHNQ